ncbi:MAG: hypothetical protein NC417_08995 [Candidatus Gastranaerophilales bacterium]|nr:hypothetical protein [Candidatus Gastranaerophilales bacterium]
MGKLSDQSGKVIARAANRAYTKGKNAVAKEAENDYLVVKNDVNNDKTLKITKATYAKPTAILRYTGKHRNLYLWDNKNAVSPNQTIRWSHGKPNVEAYEAAVTRGHAKVKLRGANKAFLQKVRSGENGEFVGLFRRKTSARGSKLVGVSAPAIPQILKNERILEQFRRSAGPMLEKRLEHEIEAVLKGVAR